MRDLVEAIRTHLEATERGQIDKWITRGGPDKKAARQGVSRYLRRATKLALKQGQEPPRRGTRGYAS